jgi:hypothetical protein
VAENSPNLVTLITVPSCKFGGRRVEGIVQGDQIGRIFARWPIINILWAGFFFKIATFSLIMVGFIPQ